MRVLSASGVDEPFEERGMNLDNNRKLAPSLLRKSALWYLGRSFAAIGSLWILVGLSACGSTESEKEARGANDGTEGVASALPQEPLPELRTHSDYGYQPRSCGFDMNDDGRVGQPEDCRVCDGSTTDPDGDGVDEDLIYVSCNGDGVNQAGCGAPDQPCASLDFAWSQADGPGDGAEDILCFRGSCRHEATLEPKSSGLDGIVTVAATGSQAREFERAKDPAMLVGWDSDGDGEYPPLDSDDVAELDGSDGPDRGFSLPATADRLEMAHFTARGFGAGADGKDSGLLAVGGGQGELSHVYLHDLHWLEINKGRPAASAVTTVDLSARKNRIRWFWLENIWAPRVGGWFVRGAAQDPGPNGGPFRFQGLTVTARGCDVEDCGAGAAFTGFHLWGYLGGIEILDSHFNAAVDEWRPKVKGGPSGARFALVAQCSEDWLLRNNLVEDFKNPVRIQGWAERYCDNEKARPLGPVWIDGNRFTNDFAPWTGGDIAVYVSEGGEDRAEVVGDVTISRNVMSAPAGWEACVWVHGGNGAVAPEGHIQVLHNTCAGRMDYHGAVVLGDTGGSLPRYSHQNITVMGNLITGLRPEDPNFRLTYPLQPGRLSANVYDSAGQFHYLEETVPDLASWRELSGQDQESAACLPSFVDYERGDFRLRADDSCAAGRVVVDALGDLGEEAIPMAGAIRSPEGPWDAGALGMVEPSDESP